MTSIASSSEAGTSITATKVSGPGSSISGTKNTAAGWAALRAERDQRLASCDWTQMPDSPLTPALRASWAGYRQALRDITSVPHIGQVVWPVGPRRVQWLITPTARSPSSRG